MGANKERGELAIVVGDATYILKLTSNAMCEMEAASGRTVVQLMATLRGGEGGNLTDTRWWLWGMLRAHHPELTLLDVGNLMDALGIAVVNAKLHQVFGLNTEEAPTAGPSNGNPPEAQPGTGGGSISTPAVLA
jgi:hypothetical protein